MEQTSLFVSFLIATSTCCRLCMRFSSAVLLLLLLCRAGVHAIDPDKDITSNADEDENTTSSAPEMPLVNNETVTEATVVTTTEKAIGPSTTVATIKPTILRCQELKDGMSISEMVKCHGKEININSTLLDLSHFKDFEIKTLLFDTDKSIRHLQSSLTLSKSEVTELELSLRPFYTLMEPEYIVTDNNKLANLRINEAAFDSTMIPKIIIKGNKLLNYATLNTLKDMIEKTFTKRDVSKSDIQEAGECRLTTTYLAEFAYLDDCGYFDGPLEINSLTQGIVPNKLSFTDLHGCLVIKNTSIRSLDFLGDLKPKCSSTNEIFGNENLCLTSERKAYWMKWLDPVNIFENSDCSDVCTPKWAEMNRNDTNIKCTKIVGNVDIVAQNDETELEYLLNVEEIEGHIKITGNTFSNFSFLANLKKINHSDKGKPAISVSNNKNMTIFNIGNLETIEKPPESGAQVVFDKNGNFTFTLEEAGKIFEIAGSATIPKPNNTVTKIVPVVANVTDEGYSEVNNTAKEAAKAERKEEENRTATIAGVTIGVVFAVLVVVGIGIAVVFLVKHCINTKKLKDKKNTEVLEEKAKPEREKKITFHVYGPALPAKPLNERTATNYVTIDMKELKESTNDFMLPDWDEKKYFKAKQEHLKLRDGKCRLARLADPEESLDIVSGGISMETPEVEKNLRPYVSTFVHYIKYRHYITEPFDYHKMQPYTYTESMTLGTIMDFLNTNLVPIPNKFTYKIVTQVLDHLSHENPETTRNNQLVRLDGPCQFVGDLNGSIYDLVSIFSLKPANHTRILGYKYVFCGNYIGGAKSDLQTLLVLLLMAKANPNIVLLRGGNEYGSRAKDFLGNAFKHHFPDIEGEKKDKLMNAFLEIFNKMPMGALINEKILAIHGGLSARMLGSPNIDALFDSIPMPLPPNPSPATTRLVEDILYSEPSTISHPINILGAGGYFNERLLKKFKGLMRLDLIVTGRAEEGYAVLMSHRLVQLCGCTDSLLAKHGVYNAYRKPAVFKCLYGDYGKTRDPAAILRVENNGELQIMTFKHNYTKTKVEELKETMKNWEVALFTKEQIQRDKWRKELKSKYAKQYEEQLRAAKIELEEKLEQIDAAEKEFLEEVPKLLDENEKLWETKFKNKSSLDRFDFCNKNYLIRIHETALHDHITVEDAINLYILYNMVMRKYMLDERHKRTRQECWPESYGLSKKEYDMMEKQCKEAMDTFTSTHGGYFDGHDNVKVLVKMYGKYLDCVIHKEEKPSMIRLLSEGKM